MRGIIRGVRGIHEDLVIDEILVRMLEQMEFGRRILSMVARHLNLGFGCITTLERLETWSSGVLGCFGNLQRLIEDNIFV